MNSSQHKTADARAGMTLNESKYQFRTTSTEQLA
jgi:hypothetical protein